MQKYQIDQEYQQWYRKHVTSGIPMLGKRPVYIDSDYTSVHHGENCVSVHEVDGVVGVGAMPARFLIPVED